MFSWEESRCDMAFIEPMHRNKPNITYLLTEKNPPDTRCPIYWERLAEDSWAVDK